MPQSEPIHLKLVINASYLPLEEGPLDISVGMFVAKAGTFVLPSVLSSLGFPRGPEAVGYIDRLALEDSCLAYHRHTSVVEGSPALLQPEPLSERQAAHPDENNIRPPHCRGQVT